MPDMFGGSPFRQSGRSKNVFSMLDSQADASSRAMRSGKRPGGLFDPVLATKTPTYKKGVSNVSRTLFVDKKQSRAMAPSSRTYRFNETKYSGGKRVTRFERVYAKKNGLELNLKEAAQQLEAVHNNLSKNSL